jgi:hypothetical protein
MAMFYGSGGNGSVSWVQQAFDLFAGMDTDLIGDWQYTQTPFSYQINLTNEQFENLSNLGFLQGGVIVQQAPLYWDRAVVISAAVIEAIRQWWTSPEAKRLYTAVVNCGVHKNGTENHEVVGTVRGIGVGVTPQQARNDAVSNANSQAAAQFGTGHHAIHCTPGSISH